jgi:cold shock CspA family protein
MAKSQSSFNKKEKERKRLKKKQEKAEKKEERKAFKKEHGSGDMIAYVDEYGNFSSTPIDPASRKIVAQEEVQIGIQKREDIPEDPIHEGKVTFFNSTKGYGFIRDISGNESYFVHQTDLVDQIEENDTVNFEIRSTPRGLSAVNVKRGGKTSSNNTL